MINPDRPTVLIQEYISPKEFNSLFPLHTSRGIAMRTIHWVASGILWAYDYDKLTLSQFKTLIQQVRRK